MCRWGCETTDTSYMCKWCGTRYCKECLRGDFHGLMTEPTKCRTCNQIRCQGVRVDYAGAKSSAADGKAAGSKAGSKSAGSSGRSRSSSPTKRKTASAKSATKSAKKSKSAKKKKKNR